MNNDASPSSSDTSHNDAHSTNPQASVEEESNSQQHKTRLQREKRAKLLDDLIRNIDIMIYGELSILYYMDCSLFHFLLRALPQWFYFTPKPPLLPLPPTTNRPYVGTIFGTNVIVLIIHLFSAAPAAGEAMRGYLHGGLLIDFVGVLGPVGKWKLVGVDLLVCVLQCCILAVFLERAAMRGEGLVARSGNVTGPVGDAVPIFGQDHDSEERGMLRTDPNLTGDIELQTLGPSNSNNISDAEERNELPAEASPSTPHDSKDHPLDTYNTGEHVVVSLHILDTLRRQWSQYGNVAAEASTSSTTSSQAAMAAAVAGRRFGFRLRVGNRVVEGPS